MPGDTLHINSKATEQNTYGAIVIGSGISGGWAAKELTEKGLKVLMLERGRDFEHVKDYKNASKDPWEFPHRGQTTVEQKKKYPVIHRGWAAAEPVMDYWANEEDCPYSAQALEADPRQPHPRSAVRRRRRRDQPVRAVPLHGELQVR